MPDRLWRLLLIAAGLMVYWNSLSGPFLLDDYGAIVENPTLRDLSALGEVLSPPSDTTVAGRPVLNLSFAVNYAVGGLEVSGYHGTNVGLHLLASLALLGFLRRALARQGAAQWLAFPIALLWSIHPLQTQAVTYTVQRAESLMGLFYLSTLYCAARGMDSGRHRWFALATVFCTFGMGTKEVMVSAPIMVLIYDRVFVSGSFLKALRERWPLYAGLLSTWILLAALVATNPRGQSVGFGFGQVSAYEYALTQTGVLVHYLRLCVFPRPLVFDYTWPIAHQLSDVVWSAATIAFLLIGMFEFLRRGSWFGFLGAWFFLILAPSSSVLPIVTETVGEQRMYLSLAAPLTLLVIGVSALLDRSGMTMTARRALGGSLLTGVVCLLGWHTAHRNDVYASAISIWQDTVRKQPDNGRAHNSLAVHLMREGRLDEAYRSGVEALRTGEIHPDVHYNLGSVLLRLNRPEEAAEQFEEVLLLLPEDSGAHANLGVALKRLGRYKKALKHLSLAAADQPENPVIHVELAETLARLGNRKRALVHLERVCELQPNVAYRHFQLGTALEQAGRVGEAVGHHREALRLNPQSASAGRLAWILATSNEPAIRDGEEALRLAQGELARFAEPTSALLDILAAAYAAAGRFEEALQAAKRAVELATEKGQDSYAEQIQERIRLYERGVPLR